MSKFLARWFAALCIALTLAPTATAGVVAPPPSQYPITIGQYLGNYYMPTVLVAKAAAMAQGTVTQAQYLQLGDSVAGNTSGIIGPNLANTLGIAGYGLDFAGGTIGNYAYAGLTNALTGTAYVNDGGANPYDYSRWMTGVLYNLPANADSVTFSVGTGYYPFTRLQVFYVQEPGAGSFTVQTNNNGAGWVTQTTINAANASTAGGVYSVTLALNPYQVKIASTGGGAVRVIGVQIVDTTVNGVVFNAIGRGGLQLVDENTTPSAITTPVLAAIAPDHVTWEMKENAFECAASTGGSTPTPYSAAGVCPNSSAPVTFASALSGFMGSIRAANSNMDVVFWGSEPTGGGGPYSDQLNNNQSTQTYAQANSLIYADMYYAVQGSYAKMVATGLIPNGELTHINNTGKAYMASLGWGLVYQPYLTLIGSYGANVNNAKTRTTSLQVAKGQTAAVAGIFDADTSNNPRLYAASGFVLQLGSNGTPNRWQIDGGGCGGCFQTVTDGAVDIGRAAAGRPGIVYVKTKVAVPNVVLTPQTYSALSTALPCAGNEGAEGAVTDSTVATFGTAIAGAGANHVHAYCNGTAWVVD